MTIPDVHLLIYAVNRDGSCHRTKRAALLVRQRVCAFSRSALEESARWPRSELMAY
jgi:hypothetical protein